MYRRIALIAVGLALVAAACGGGDGGSGIASLESDSDEVIAAMDEGAAAAGDPSAADTSAQELDPEEAMLAFAACMRENGVDMADPTVDEDGNLRLGRPQGAGQGEGTIDREAINAARDACHQYLDGVVQQFDRPDVTELQDQLLDYAACMRDNGYDMADPDLTAFTPGAGAGGGRPEGSGIFGGALDREDPAFIAANDVCQDLFAGGFGAGGGGLGGRG